MPIKNIVSKNLNCLKGWVDLNMYMYLAIDIAYTIDIHCVLFEFSFVS